MNDTWALSLAGPMAWSTLVTSGVPPPRQGHSAILDAANNRMIVYGGTSGSFPFDDAWALPLSGIAAWTPLALSGPGGRAWHTAIYDAPRGRMVVFGGESLGVPNNQLWTLSLGLSPSWAPLAVSGMAPDARSGHVAVYETAADGMIPFGGRIGAGSLNDEWMLSLSGTLHWVRLIALDYSPPPRPRSAACGIYDRVRDRLVVIDGGDNGVPLRDSWYVTGTNPVWSSLTIAPRQQHSALSDAGSGRLLVFGGGKDAFDPLGDLWAFGATGVSWSRLPNGPSRAWHTMVYDSNRG